MVNIIVIDIGEFVNGEKSYLFFKLYDGYVLRSDATTGIPMQLIHGDWVGYIDFDKFALHTSFAEYPPILRYAMVTKQDLHYSDSDSNLADFDASLVEWVVNPAVIEQSTKTAVQPSKFELMAELIIEELKSSCPDIGLREHTHPQRRWASHFSDNCLHKVKLLLRYWGLTLSPWAFSFR
jgi:hypothetical protein